MSPQAKTVRRIALELVRFLLGQLTADERVEFWQEARFGYCEHCGFEIEGRTCHCTNDD